MTTRSSRFHPLLSVAFFAAAVAFSSLQIVPELSHLPASYSGGLSAGISAGQGIDGVGNGSPRAVIARIVNTALSYVAILAVSVIALAGMYMIISFGNDQAKETAKKVIMYTAIGLLIILLSKTIVALFISFAA